MIDFSKVISPIGISKNLANNLSKYLILNQNEIRKIYKSHISDLVTGKISINIIIDEMKPFLNKHSTVKSIIKQFNTIPILDKDFLDIILILKKKYKIIMVSDIYEELGDLITKRLTKYFDDFIFSYKVGVKKSDDMFWQILIKEIKPEQIKIFIDDKEENINIANKY